jgi:hypothetical protein
MKPLQRRENGQWVSRCETVNARLRVENEARARGWAIKEWRDGKIVVIVKMRGTRT